MQHLLTITGIVVLGISMAPRQALSCWAKCPENDLKNCNKQIKDGQLVPIAAFLNENPNFCIGKKPGVYRTDGAKPFFGLSTHPRTEVYCSEKSAWLMAEFATQPKSQIQFFPMGSTAQRCATDESCPEERSKLINAPWTSLASGAITREELEEGSIAASPDPKNLEGNSWGSNGPDENADSSKPIKAADLGLEKTGTAEVKFQFIP